MDMATLNFTKPISRYISIVSDNQRMFIADFIPVNQCLGCSYSLKIHILAKIGPFCHLIENQCGNVQKQCLEYT